MNWTSPSRLSSLFFSNMRCSPASGLCTCCLEHSSTRYLYGLLLPHRGEMLVKVLQRTATQLCPSMGDFNISIFRSSSARPPPPYTRLYETWRALKIASWTQTSLSYQTYLRFKRSSLRSRFSYSQCSIYFDFNFH